MMDDPEWVLGLATDVALAAFGSRLIASFAIGSLAHGGFCPMVSDVDLAIVIADPLTAADAQEIDEITSRVRSEGALAERLSLFWASPTVLRSSGPGGRLPALDRLDLATHGRELFGGFDLRSIWRPSTELLVIEAVQFATERLAAPAVGSELRDAPALVAQGPRRLTKRVLFPVRFLFTAATGEIGRNDAAVLWYVSAGRPASNLVQHAQLWRTTAVDAGIAIRLVADEIVGLYDEFIYEHMGLMAKLDEQGSREKLLDWKARLHT